MVGPLIGEYVNINFGGYLPSLLVFSSLLALNGFVNLFLLPATLNRKPVISNEEFKEMGEKAPIKV